MNAGANGSNVSRVVTHVESVTRSGTHCVQRREELDFSYRTSPFQASKSIVVAARFRLTRSDTAREQQRAFLAKRTASQPYSLPSAGCIFRNPDGASAGFLIESCGLKGMRIGGAEVSDLHANFIVNRGGATSRDILTLIDHIKHRVAEKTGHILTLEVEYVPG